MKKAAFVMVLFSLGIFSLPGRAEAKTKHEKKFLSQFHTDYGIEFYNQKKYEQAIEQFSKVLILDNTNGVAREYLRNIAKDKDFWPGGYNLPLLRFVELTEYNDFLKSRIIFLNTNNAMLTNFVLTRGEYDPAVIKEAREIENVIKARFPNPETGTRHTAPEFLKTPADITAYTQALLDDKIELIEALEELQAFNRQLRTVKRDVISHIGDERKKEQVARIDGRIEMIHVALAAKDEVIEKQTKQYDELNAELKKVNGEFSQVQSRLKDAEKKIVGLTKDLAGMSLDSMEKSKLLAQKDSRMSDLEKDLIESRERLGLVQRIIREKDDHILVLEEELAGIENRLEGQDDLARAAVENLSQQTKGGMSKIDELEKQVALLNDRYKQAEKDMRSRDDKIKELEKAVTRKDGALSRYKSAFLNRDQEVSKLNGIVQIYRSRLIETATDLKVKSEAVDRLQKQMNDLDLRLQDVKLEDTNESKAGMDILSADRSNRAHLANAIQ